MQGAPVRPVEPPTTSTWPLENFVESASRRGIASNTPSAISPQSGSAGPPSGIPISITWTSPACCLPGAIHRPGLGRWKVAVATASIATSWTAPVEASTPLGTSHATTGASSSLSARIAERTGSRTSPENPVPSMQSTTTATSSSAAATKGCGSSPSRSRLTFASPL
jgi:hypothetical protein